MAITRTRSIDEAGDTRKLTVAVVTIDDETEEPHMRLAIFTPSQLSFEPADGFDFICSESR